MRAVGHIFGAIEHATDERRHAESVEKIGFNLEASQANRVLVGEIAGDRPCLEGSDGLERAVVAAQIEVR